MSENLVVHVSEGKVQGKTGTNVFGGKYYSFQGLPYAKPPLGQLRFKAPQPPEKWSGILDGTKEGSECYAKNLLLQYQGSEDCLFLNVYTPQLPAKVTKLKPVMVWIHGGGFTSGSSSCSLYGPEYLLTEDIVLITINYRTGVLGFLCLENDSLKVPGNAGLKDMVMALKWVQKNIKQFAGNPRNVTIFGESAGGAAVHYLMLSPMAKGLFHRAIAQSGCALNSWTRGTKSAYQLAGLTNFESFDEKQILKHLQSLSVEELYEGVEKIKDVFIIGNVRPFCPVVEKRSKEMAFITKEPIEILKSGRYNKVPLMIGYTSREGMLLYGRLKESRYFLRDETLVPLSMNLRKGSPLYKDIAQRIRDFYFQGGELNGGNVETASVFKLYTDNYFLVDIYNTAKHHVNTSHAPTYFYRFSLNTNLNCIKKLLSISEPGTCHGDDICYLFKGEMSPEIEPNSREEIAIKMVTKMWTNFAKYGNPTPHETDPQLDISWPPITKNLFTYLDINNVLKVEIDPEKNAMDFWNNLYEIKEALSKL